MKILLILLSIITAISGYVGYVQGQKTIFEAEKTINNTTATEKPITEVESSKSIHTNANYPVSSTVSVTLTVQDKSFPLSIEPSGTAYDLMKTAEQLGFITMKTKDYGGDLGQLVEEINGIKNNVRDKTYWIYSINGAKAQIGISNYQLKAGDTISWNYENETL